MLVGCRACPEFLRESYPAALLAFGDDLPGRDALAVLAAASSPEAAKGLTIGGRERLLRKSGRQRYVATAAHDDPYRAAHRAAAGTPRRGLRQRRRGSVPSAGHHRHRGRGRAPRRQMGPVFWPAPRTPRSSVASPALARS